MVVRSLLLILLQYLISTYLGKFISYLPTKWSMKSLINRFCGFLTYSVKTHAVKVGTSLKQERHNKLQKVATYETQRHSANSVIGNKRRKKTQQLTPPNRFTSHG